MHGLAAAEASQTFGWIFAVFGALGPLSMALVARRLEQRGRADANITAAMIGGMLAATLLATFLIPMFFLLVEKLANRRGD